MGHNHNNSNNPNLQVSILPNIGLDSDATHSTVGLLNLTLADEAVLTTKTRIARWNVHGAGFFELYTLFETQSQLLNNISDEITERVRILGGIGFSTFEELLRYTRLEEKPGVVPDILRLLADHEACIRFLREDARKASKMGEDEGTFELLVRAMHLHEKMAWMLRSYIEKEPIQNESPKRMAKDE